MSQPVNNVARLDLATAMTEHHCVRVRRSIALADEIVGYVVAVGPHWLLLSVSDGAFPNGWVAVRSKDVELAEPADEAPFMRRGLEWQHNWPPAAPTSEVDLSGGIRALLGSVATAFPMATLYREHQNGASCLVGRPGLLSSNEVEWQEMSPDAIWANHVTVCRSSTITRLDFGGQYETALAHAADLRALLGTRGAHASVHRDPKIVERMRQVSSRPWLSLA
jgi:hypothetical protein